MNLTNPVTRRGVITLLAMLTVSLFSATGDLKQPVVGEMAPGFTLKNLDGKVLTLEQQRGKFVVLHFAASW